MLTPDQLVAAIESSSLLTPPVPGQLMTLDLPGVGGHYTKFSHPFANSVSAAKLTEENADHAIRTVQQFFFDRNLAFTWKVGPLTTPTNLALHLEQAGFEKVVEMAGLALTDLATPFPHDGTVHVREAGYADRDVINHVGTEGFEMPEEITAIYNDSYLNPGSLRVRLYLAYADGSDTPGAFAASAYVPNAPIVSLSGAATLPDQRGKGLYSALVARRLADAHADGMQAAIINAVRTTSAPILLKRGFTELCDLEIWAASPGEKNVVTA